MSELKSKIKELFAKIKKVKHHQVYLAVIVGVIACMLYLSFSGIFGTKAQTNVSTQDDKNELNFSSSMEYVSYLENKLESVITNVKGVGKASIFISLEKGFEYIYVTEEETSTTSNGTTVNKVNVVMLNGQPILKEEIYPKIKGIVVVAQGAGDVKIKMNILSLIQTVIDVENSKINILESV